MPEQSESPENHPRVVHHQQHVEQFSGPIPPPQVFVAYEKILPGAADRILKMAERQAAHRQSLERFAIIGDLGKEAMGTVLAYIAFGGSMVGAVILLLHDKPIEGLTTFVVAIGAAFGPKIYTQLFLHPEPKSEIATTEE